MADLMIEALFFLPCCIAFSVCLGLCSWMSAREGEKWLSGLNVCDKLFNEHLAQIWKSPGFISLFPFLYVPAGILVMCCLSRTLFLALSFLVFFSECCLLWSSPFAVSFSPISYFFPVSFGHRAVQIVEVGVIERVPGVCVAPGGCFWNVSSRNADLHVAHWTCWLFPLRCKVLFFQWKKRRLQLGLFRNWPSSLSHYAKIKEYLIWVPTPGAMLMGLLVCLLFDLMEF